MKSSIGMDNTTATSRAKDGWGLLYVRRTRKCAVEGGWREVEAKLLLEIKPEKNCYYYYTAKLRFYYLNE